MKLPATRDLLTLIGQLADGQGLKSLSYEELNILLPWGALGIIGNGGFKYFFDGETDLDGVARGFRTLGFDRAAEVCEEVQSRIFVKTPSTVAERRKILDTVDWKQFATHEEVIYDLTFESLLEAIERYVAFHRKAFARWAL